MKPMCIWRSMRPEQEKAKVKENLVHFPRQIHRTETRKATQKAAMAGMMREHQKLLVKSQSWKANRRPCTNFKKGSCQRKIHEILGMFPNAQNSKRQVEADSETSVQANTQQNLLMKRQIHHRLLFTFHQMINDRYGKFGRMTRPNTD